MWDFHIRTFSKGGRTFDDTKTESLVLIALLAVATGVTIPAYHKIVVSWTAQGQDLTMLGHMGAFGLGALAGIGGLIVFWLLLWGGAVVIVGVSGAVRRFRKDGGSHDKELPKEKQSNE